MQWGTKQGWAEAGKAWAKALLGIPLGLAIVAIAVFAYEYVSHYVF